MSIEEALRALTDGTGNKLTFLVPAMPGVPVLRDVYVSKEVLDLVGDAPSIPEELERVSAQARARLDKFSEGKFVVFGMDPFNKSVITEISRNKPVSDGIVEFRITEPDPALRIFGGFLQVDLLVLLTWAPRESLDFEREVQRCRIEWDKLFPSHPPMVAGKTTEYVSTKCIAG